MNWRKYVETQTVPVTLGTKTAVTVRKRRLWLEGIIAHFTVTVGASPVVTGQSPERAFTLLKEVTLDVHDGAPRQMIRARGSALLELAHREGQLLSTATTGNQGATMAVNNTYRFAVPINIVPPHVEDPIGSFLALPLSALNEEPVLTLDLATGLEVLTTGSSTNITGATCELEYHFRDIQGPAPLYFPSEIITNKKVWAGGKQDYELPGTGFLACLLAQDWNSTGTSRTTSQTDTTTYADVWSIYYGQSVVHKGSVAALFASSEMHGAFVGYGHGSANGSWFINASWFRDFLRDRAFAGSFNAASCLNLNSISAGGDKVRIEGSNTVANAFTYFTHRKFLADSIEKLTAL